jgi:hypothetical protein
MEAMDIYIESIDVSHFTRKCQNQVQVPHLASKRAHVRFGIILRKYLFFFPLSINTINLKIQENNTVWIYFVVK